LEKRDCEVEILTLREMQIAPCTGCFGCWVKTPGICTIPDAGRDVTRAMIQSNLVVLFTPVTFGGYSSELKKAVDRSLSLLSPFFMRVKGMVRHRSRYRRYPRLVAFGVEKQADPASERLFTDLVDRQGLNMHSPAHAAGVGVLSDDSETLRRRIGTLLSEVGVGR
jgi:multimeric flavodoxin WrbA